VLAQRGFWFLEADEIRKLQMVLKLIRQSVLCFLSLNCKTIIDELFESSDNTLFSAILNNPGHVLRFFFPFPM